MALDPTVDLWGLLGEGLYVCKMRCVVCTSPHSSCDRCVTIYHTCVASPGMQVTAAVGAWGKPATAQSSAQQQQLHLLLCLVSPVPPQVQAGAVDQGGRAAARFQRSCCLPLSAFGSVLV